MPVTLEKDTINEAYEVIKNNAKDLGTKESADKTETIVFRYAPQFMVNESDYTKYLKDNGVAPDVVKKLTMLEQAWNSGAAKFASEKLCEVSEKALNDVDFMNAAGPKYLKSTVFTATKDGKKSVTVNGYQENRNLRATGDDDALIKTYGSVTIKHRITKGFDVTTMETIKTDVENLLKGKF